MGGACAVYHARHADTEADTRAPSAEPEAGMRTSVQTHNDAPYLKRDGLYGSLEIG